MTRALAPLEHCPQCSYDLRAHDRAIGSRCPECGCHLGQAVLLERERRFFRRMIVGTIVILALGGAAFAIVSSGSPQTRLYGIPLVLVGTLLAPFALAHALGRNLYHE